MLFAVCAVALPGNLRRKFSPTGLVSSLRICRGLHPTLTLRHKAFSLLCA